MRLSYTHMQQQGSTRLCLESADNAGRHGCRPTCPQSLQIVHMVSRAHQVDRLDALQYKHGGTTGWHIMAPQQPVCSAVCCGQHQGQQQRRNP
jgi:hypothetical protein